MRYPLILCSVTCCLTYFPTLFSTTYNLTVTTPGDTNVASAGVFNNVTNQGDLRGVLNYVNTQGGSSSDIYNVSFNLGGSNSIQLQAMLPIINLNANPVVNIDGANGGGANPSIVIDGNSLYRGFFAEKGQISLQNLTIQNVNAMGGNGGNGIWGGGGGLGAGAGLFVDQAQVTISNISISSANATGGTAGTLAFNTAGPGGGGGMGGNGGSSNGLSSLSAGGGGGIGGNAGDSGDPNPAGMSGGGGINCGNNTSTAYTGAGGTGQTNGVEGGGLGGASAGNGATPGGGTGGATGGGGGGSPNSFTINGGGGGGIGGQNGGATLQAGGNGGFGGGGGGGDNQGGNGGFGGGGGAGRQKPLPGSTGGDGGFGGGGGAATSKGGDGGFGGGGGSAAFGQTGGIGGVGGSRFLGAAGGGGAGFGGAIFVNNGTGHVGGTAGSLTIKGSFLTGSGVFANSVNPGPGGCAPSNLCEGWAAGSDAFFLSNTSISLDPNGSTIVFNSSIADDSSASFVGANPYITIGIGSGAVLNVGNVSSSAGIVTLMAANTYSGGTILNKGILAVGNNSSLGSGTLTFAQPSAILQAAANSLTLSNSILLNANGIINSNNNTFTINGNITSSGAHTLIKQGSGAVILKGINTYSGGTIVDAGTLEIDTVSSLPVGGAIDLSAPGATLFLNTPGGSITVGDLIGVGDSFVNLASNNNLILGTSSPIVTFSGTIQGSGSITKEGSGAVVFDGTNTYSGGTYLLQGTLVVGATNALGTGTLTFDGSGTTLQATTSLTLSNPISLANHAQIDTNGQILNLSNNISNSAPLTKIGAGALILSGINNYTGGTFLSQGTLAVGSDNALGSGTLTFNTNSGNILQATASVNLSSPISLLMPGTVDTNGQTLTLSGGISGSNALTKTGSGTLILSNPNSYSGGTFLSQGTLSLGDSQALGTGTLTFNTLDGNILQPSANNLTISNPIALSKNGVVDTNNQTLTLAGLITGPGGLNKTGAGQLILTGTHSFIGPTTVTQDTLTIDGSITSPITVLPDGILNGSGSITGDVVIQGMLGPGDMIGNIEVIGNVSFETGSIFQVQLNPSTADFLDVDASANINIQSGSTIQIVPTPATYGTNIVYHVAQAGESGGLVIGEFDNVVNTYPLINAVVVYDTASPPVLTQTNLAVINQISLRVNFQPFSTEINEGNPGAIAKSLNGFTPVPGSDMFSVMQQLYFLPTLSALKSAFNQMQPSLLNNLTLAQQNSSLFVSSAFNKHTFDLRQGRSPCLRIPRKRWEVWGDASFDWAKQRGNHSNVGFDASVDLGAAGVDYRISEQFYIGAMGAYTSTSVHCHDHLAKGYINTYYAGLYSNWLSSSFFANAFLLGDTSDFHSTRFVSFGDIHRHPKGHHRGYGLIAHLDFGACLPKKHRAQFYPYAQFDYVYQHEKGYTETNAQSLNNHILARNPNMLRSEIGLQGRFCHTAAPKKALIPGIKLGWANETRFQGKKIHARLVDVPNGYTVKGLYPTRNLLAVGASLTSVISETADLSLNYEGFFGSGYHSNAGNATLKIKF